MRVKEIEFHGEGFIEVMKSPGVQKLVKGAAEEVARRAGRGYVAEGGTQGKTRTRAWVIADTPRAKRDNAKNATLLRALGG